MPTAGLGKPRPKKTTVEKWDLSLLMNYAYFYNIFFRINVNSSNHLTDSGEFDISSKLPISLSITWRYWCIFALAGACIERVKRVLSPLQIARNGPKIEEEQSLQQCHNLFWTVLYGRRLKLAKCKVDAFKKRRTLRNTTGSCLFLKICNSFGRFLLSFARITAPLNKKLNKR